MAAGRGRCRQLRLASPQDATNEVLIAQGREPVTVEEYKIGCRYTTPARFNFHMGLEKDDPQGATLGQIFDTTYVARVYQAQHPAFTPAWPRHAPPSLTSAHAPTRTGVSPSTAGLFDGMDRLLRSLALAGHPQAALSNACGSYVRAVMAANALDEKPGERVALMQVSPPTAQDARHVPQPAAVQATEQ